MHSIKFTFIGLLTIFFMAVQPSYSKVSDPSVTINPAQGQVTEEGLVRLTLPETLIQNILSDYLVASEEYPERYLKEITRFKLDPMAKNLLIEGSALIPQDIVRDMDEIAGGEVFSSEQKFRLIVEFPSAQKLSVSSYVVFKVVELNIGGQDYTSGVTRIGEFLVSFLSQTSLMDWILEGPESVGSQAQESLSEDRDSLRLKKLFDSKEIMIRNQSIYLKLDFSKIGVLSSYASLTEFRLWNLYPVLLKGTDIAALQMEAGLGKPGQAWFDAISKRGEGETQSLKEAKKELYIELGNSEKMYEELYSYALVTKNSLNFPIWERNQENDFEELQRKMRAKISAGLSIDNPIFSADPIWGHDNTKEETKALILSELVMMKKQSLAQYRIEHGGSADHQGLPLLTQKLSQRSLSQGIRFARDFNFDQGELFAELDVVLAPQIPGVILRGLMNMDVRTFMELGLEGEGIDWGNTPWHISKDIWNKALPFELSLRFHMFDNGELGVDIQNFSILSGSEKMNLSANNGHAQIMIKWTKMALVEALTTMAMDDSSDTSLVSEESDSQSGDNDLYFKETLNKIQIQALEYAKYTATEFQQSAEDQLLKLVKLAEIDIAKNPFNQVGSQEVATKVRYLFEDLISYDDSTGLMLFKVDPKIAAKKIYETSNQLQVWNIESLYDQSLNQVFLEASIGEGVRSKTYIDYISERQEKKDSENFSGTSLENKTAPSDLITEMSFSYFENFINQIFSDASDKQLKEVSQLLREDREQSHYLMRDLNISASSDNRLLLNMTVQVVEKKKNGLLARLFSEEFKVEQKAFQVGAKINLTTESLEKYKNQLTLAPDEVFFGDEVLSIDLESVGLQIKGDTGLLDKAINLVARKVDFKGNSLAKKAKVLALDFIQKYLHSTEATKNGKVELGGIKINRYAKVLTHREELLIQLNPHILSAAFDIRSVGNQVFGGKKIGTVISKKDDSILFHFSTSGNMAAVDKGALVDIMKDSKALFSDLVAERSLSEVTDEELLVLYDRAIHNSDYSKLSLFHRLKKVLSYYQGVQEVVKTDDRLIQAIHSQINEEFGITSAEFNNRMITGAGVEVMYFLASAYFLKSGLDQVIGKLEYINREVPYLLDMKNKSRELQERFISPLLEIYETHFLKKNESILNKGPTDWNYTYYSDALYSQKTYSVVSQILKHNKESLRQKENRGE
tara:strand:- start:17105 stop:20692 length:3588 start_codon:yes stop_codon:yes gene_type:complete